MCIAGPLSASNFSDKKKIVMILISPSTLVESLDIISNDCPRNAFTTLPAHSTK